MGKLGYSSVTITDLTESIPVSLILEINKEKNIQTKAGTTYSPDFTEDGGELIVTPSLFLGQKDLLEDPSRKENFINPNERESGYLYYKINNVKYYYTSSDKTSGIWVDENGRLHYKKNLTENLVIHAEIKNFQNKEQGVIITSVVAENPVQILFLDDRVGDYSVVITSEDGRQHFEDSNSNDITLTANLYYKTEKIISLDDYSFSWELLVNKSPDPVLGTGQTQTIKRSHVVSEEKVICTITNKNNEFAYSGSIDIWDLKDEYDCKIITDTALVSPTTTAITAWVELFNSSGEALEPSNLSNFTFEWGYYYKQVFSPL